MRELFKKFCQVTNDTQQKLWEFWKDHFTILNCLTLIDNAWTKENSEFCMEKHWPDIGAELDSEGSEPVLIYEVVSMGKHMGLKVEIEDVHELLKSHKIELNTEELQHLLEEQKNLG